MYYNDLENFEPNSNHYNLYRNYINSNFTF